LKQFNEVLITGGAGYIGSVLVRKLVEEGYHVKILDCLVYGKDGIASLLENKSVELIKEDIRNEKILKRVTAGIDCVIHLAAIVGQPLCSKIPLAAKQINELATKKLVDICKQNGVKRFVFSSTCSNYGSTNEVSSETSQLYPLGLYSETKVNSENYILNSKDNDFHPCVLRFATAFGLSPRMRFDILLGEFLRGALIDKKILVYGPDYWRPIIHISDISHACILTIESDKELISGEVYNVGSNEQNYKKIELAKLVQEHLPSTEIKIIENRKDPRNYRVSFEKIKNKLDFEAKIKASDGILEIINAVHNAKIDPRDTELSNMSKITEQVKAY